MVDEFARWPLLVGMVLPPRQGSGGHFLTYLQTIFVCGGPQRSPVIKGSCLVLIAKHRHPVWLKHCIRGIVPAALTKSGSLMQRES